MNHNFSHDKYTIMSHTSRVRTILESATPRLELERTGRSNLLIFFLSSFCPSFTPYRRLMALIVFFLVILGSVLGFRMHSARLTRLTRSFDLIMELDTGDYENVKFTKVADIGSVSKYRLEATLSAAEMNVYLEEYKDEMKRRKVVFPGFRPGKLPPFVMGDVRRYLVCYGLENTIGQLCNYNSLVMCDEEGKEVDGFGEDELYKHIIHEDGSGQFRSVIVKTVG